MSLMDMIGKFNGNDELFVYDLNGFYRKVDLTPLHASVCKEKEDSVMH